MSAVFLHEEVRGFTESRGCKQWLQTVPLTNAAHAVTALRDGVHALNARVLPALERLKCLEIVRPKVVFVLNEQRARYYRKPLPLPPQDMATWLAGRDLLADMEAGYAAVAEAAESEPELVRLRALALQRGVRHVAAQMSQHCLLYRRVDERLWARLHAWYLRAEAAGLQDERVKDSLEGHEGGSSVAESYARALLLQAAGPHELTPPEIEFTDALLRQWARKARMGRADAMPGLVVDAATAHAPRAPIASETMPAGARFLETIGLSMSLRKRIKALKDGEDPASLALPARPADMDPLGLLQRLHRAWCEPGVARTAARKPEDPTAGLVFNFADIHFFLTGGKLFEQPDRKRELTPREKQDIEVFGRVTERTHSLMAGERKFLVEPWSVIDEQMGSWRIERPASTSRSVAIGRLVALRPGESGGFLLGRVSGVVHERDGRVAVTVTLFPGRPEPTPVRAGGARDRPGAEWSEGFRLPALDKLNLPETLVVPSHVAQPGRRIELWDCGEPRPVTVDAVLDRGADFDRVCII